MLPALSSGTLSMLYETTQPEEPDSSAEESTTDVIEICAIVTT
jgi:hypothetical protein